MNGYIAIDIGGTDIKYSVVDQNLKLLNVKSEKSAAKMGGRALIEQLKKIISHLLNSTKLTVIGIGISTAGIVNPANKKIIYANQNIPNYVGTDFQKEIGNFFNLPISVENDVNCALLGEQWATFKDVKNDFILLTFGTGIGCGIWLNEKIYRGTRLAAGNVGESKVSDSIFERQCSTAALVRRSQIKFPDLSINSGKDVYDLARDHPEIKSFLKEYYAEIADWLTVFTNFIDVKTIIIGGGISKNIEFIEGITTAFERLNSNKLIENTLITAAKLGNNAGMIGAVKNLVITELGEKNE